MESDNESMDSDRELQVAFESGLLKPGLNIPVNVPQKAINNIPELKACLSEFAKKLPWAERLDLTVEPAATPQALQDMSVSDGGGDVHDDFKREMLFYCQAQAAVLAGLPLLKKAGIPTKRPADYFAEMAKSDNHMKKVREKLLSKQVSMERSEKAKKMRELRKYGKKVQQEVLQKRQKEKREMMEAVKKYRQGKQSQLDFLEEETPKTKGKRGNQEGKIFQPNKKRQAKNEKYGFGGQKKRQKYNNAKSAASMGEYNVRKHGTAPGKVKKVRPGNRNKKRPGKNRRQQIKNKKR